MALTDRRQLVVFALLAALLAPALAHARPGDLDRSFGDGGKVRTRFEVHDGAYSVATYSHGRTVAAGVTSSGKFALARYRRNGTLDDSFSGNGKVRTDFGGGASARSVAIDAKRRIVAVGDDCGVDDSDCDFALARYHRNGSLDRTFSGDGRVVTDFGASAGARSVAIDSRGRIVVAGPSGGQLAIARYKQNGGLDPSFGSDGTVMTEFGGPADVSGSVAIDLLNRIVVVGSSAGDFALARYRPNGTLDPSFGGDGEVMTDFRGSSHASSVVIGFHGRIVAAGGTASGKFALASYKRNGTLDDSFSGNGKLRTKFGRHGANSVAIDSHGRIVAVGGEDDFRVARYGRSGRLDRSFSGDGKVTTHLAFASAESVAIDSRNRIIVAGFNSGHFELVRYVGYRRRR
jgi:uncharacterized delta-60 repeat protein